MEGRGEGEVQRGRDSYVRGPLSTQSDDYTRGSRVTIHLVLPRSTLLRTSNGRRKKKKRILLTSDTDIIFTVRSMLKKREDDL